MSDFNPYGYSDDTNMKDQAPSYTELSPSSNADTLYSSPAQPNRYNNNYNNNTAAVPLPPGWVQYFSEQGLPYYVNSQLNITQWNMPTSNSSPPPPPADAYPGTASDHSVLSVNKVNKVNYSSINKVNKVDDSHTGLLSRDITSGTSDMNQYKGTSQLYDESNIDSLRRQYDNAQPYSDDVNNRFLDRMSMRSTRLENSSSRTCSHVGRQVMWWITSISTIACLILAIVGHLMPLKQSSWSDTMEMSDTALFFIIFGWSFGGSMLFTFGLMTLLKACMLPIAWSSTNVMSAETAKAILYSYTCCLSVPIQEQAGWKTKEEFVQFNDANRRAVPSLRLKFEQYRYTGVGKNTSTTLWKTIDVPILGYKDISPPIPSMPTFSSLVDITYRQSYSLPPEQRDAIDYLKKLMIKKWGQEKDKYFTITEDFNCSVPAGPDYVLVPNQAKVYTPSSDPFGTLCCFNPLMSFLWIFVVGLYGPYFSYFYWSIGSSMNIQVIKAIQLGPIPQDLLEQHQE